MRYAVIDAAALTGRQDLHEKLARRLSLPAWYGRNLDALYDCLTEPGGELVLRIENPQALSERLGDYAGPFLRVLDDAQADGRFRLELPAERKAPTATE